MGGVSNRILGQIISQNRSLGKDKNLGRTSPIPEHFAFWHEAIEVFKHLLNLKHGNSHVEFAGIRDMVYGPQNAQYLQN